MCYNTNKYTTFLDYVFLAEEHMLCYVLFGALLIRYLPMGNIDKDTLKEYNLLNKFPYKSKLI